MNGVCHSVTGSILLRPNKLRPGPSLVLYHRTRRPIDLKWSIIGAKLWISAVEHLPPLNPYQTQRLISLIAGFMRFGSYPTRYPSGANPKQRKTHKLFYEPNLPEPKYPNDLIGRFAQSKRRLNTNHMPKHTPPRRLVINEYCNLHHCCHLRRCRQVSLLFEWDVLAHRIGDI
jgi:hypothetical protein